VWGNEEGKGYIVRSGYALRENIDNSMTREVFQMLWSLKVAPTTQILV